MEKKQIMNEIAKKLDRIKMFQFVILSSISRLASQQYVDEYFPEKYKDTIRSNNAGQQDSTGSFVLRLINCPNRDFIGIR